MGEVVVSSEGGNESEVDEIECVLKTENQNKTEEITADGGGDAAAGGVRWERFLPKMAVRVLLVEADDSTRQIIAALLRKCSYRVAAVPDGLKAWEVLKGSPYNIDLILTEVELPSISGYALLTLIMAHEVCKNIPVIMMSSQDSVITVYKCMLRGATDFLLKPVRKNELRNLWQHVWRKQASNTAAGLGPPDECVQQKDETTEENNAVNRECVEKGSDAQSSSTKPESIQEECHQESIKSQVHYNETGETHDVDAENTHVLENSSREAIDLVGAFDNHPKGNFGSSVKNVSANKFHILPFLDMSLRRPLPSGSMNQVNDERPRLNHSDASAFSRYINNKPPLLRKPTSILTYTQQKDQETNFKKQSSNFAPDNHVSMARIQTGQPEIAFSYSHNRDQITHPIPVRGVRFESTNNAYNSVMPSLYRAQSGSSSLSSPRTPHHTESFPQSSPFYPPDHQPSGSRQFRNLVDQEISNSTGQAENKSQNLEDQSGNSSSGNSNKGHDKMYAMSVIKSPSERGNEDSFLVHEGTSRRSMQREAALSKFRMKRKHRCFEKKVRYENRKKLAEQRPRVKGQFIRQVPNDPQYGNKCDDMFPALGHNYRLAGRV